MRYNSVSHHRQSIRMKGYNYAQNGIYFITVCTHNRDCFFAEISTPRVLTRYGFVVRDAWNNTPIIRPNILLDAFVIMPNHIHGIIVIRRVVPCRNESHGEKSQKGVLRYAPTASFRSPSQTIGAIIRGFKSSTTKQINQIRGTPNLPVWQRNYYEHIIRNEEEMNRIREYIITNPQHWINDIHFMKQSDS
ncbi:MAG: transposase [Desulfobulbaceae bacterium]|nr:transposase [Desulfobulbaceae bacterium]